MRCLASPDDDACTLLALRRQHAAAILLTSFTQSACCLLLDTACHDIPANLVSVTGLSVSRPVGKYDVRFSE